MSVEKKNVNKILQLQNTSYKLSVHKRLRRHYTFIFLYVNTFKEFTRFKYEIRSYENEFCIFKGGN